MLCTEELFFWHQCSKMEERQRPADASFIINAFCGPKQGQYEGLGKGYIWAKELYLSHLSGEVIKWFLFKMFDNEAGLS